MVSGSFESLIQSSLSGSNPERSSVFPTQAIVRIEFFSIIERGVGSNPTNWLNCPKKAKSAEDGRDPSKKGKLMK